MIGGYVTNERCTLKGINMTDYLVNCGDGRDLVIPEPVRDKLNEHLRERIKDLENQLFTNQESYMRMSKTLETVQWEMDSLILLCDEQAETIKDLKCDNDNFRQIIHERIVDQSDKLHEAILKDRDQHISELQTIIARRNDFVQDLFKQVDEAGFLCVDCMFKKVEEMDKENT